MPVDPFLEPLLSSLPPTNLQAIDDFGAYRTQLRQQNDALAQQLCEPGPEVEECRDVALAVHGGTIGLRIYRPAGPGPFPAHLYLHGGGWVVGDVQHDLVDIQGRERAAGASCVVVAVDYRKAPEHRFPTGLGDCYAALTWLHEHADEIGVRRDLITVGGHSAGGNLSAALALKVRDEGGPSIALQLLEVPALDLTLSLPSHETYGCGYGLDLADVKTLVELYLRSPEDAADPYASPLLAPDLSGLPPAHIMSAEYDMLRDDGERYAERLRQAGVPVTFSLQAGHVHGSSAFTNVMASARAWRDEVLTVLRREHQRAGVIRA
jgi:acetyl esterase